MRTLKILFITVRSDQGGGPKHLVDLLTELKSQHCKLEIFIASPLDAPYAKAFTQLTQNHVQIPAQTFSPLHFVKLGHFIRRNKIDIVHGHGRGAGLYARLLKLVDPSLKIVHTFHGIHVPPGMVGRVKLWVDKILCALTDQFIFVSNDEQGLGLKVNVACSSKSVVIHNGIPVLTQLPAPPAPFPIKLATLARLNYQKGIDLGLKLLAHFAKKYPSRDWVWEIAGEGEERSRLENEVGQLALSSKIIFRGEQTPQDFLRDKHLYLSFSRWEGLPLAPLEAMMLGVPCFLSQVTGHGDIVQAMPEIKTFELEREESFCSQLDWIASNYETYRKNCIAQRPVLVHQFSVSSMATRVSSVYQQLRPMRSSHGHH